MMPFESRRYRMSTPTLQRIDCVLYTVPEADFADAKTHYENVLGLEKLWERPDQAGFRMECHEEGVAEIVLSVEMDVPQGLVHYLVESVQETVDYYFGTRVRGRSWAGGDTGRKRGDDSKRVGPRVRRA